MLLNPTYVVVFAKTTQKSPIIEARLRLFFKMSNKNKFPVKLSLKSALSLALFLDPSLQKEQPIKIGTYVVTLQ